MGSRPSAKLVALRVADGKPEWNHLLPGGDLALSDGLLFLSDGGVHAFASAERNCGMAVDSPHPEEYDAVPAEMPEPKPAATARNPRLADASVVRLYWGISRKRC